MSALRLVTSQPAVPTFRPGPELCRAVAATVAAYFRGVWVPREIGPGGILELIGRHVTEVRGFTNPEDVETIVVDVIDIMVEAEAAAEAAFRRPPRRHRPRATRGEQLELQFGDAA